MDSSPNPYSSPPFDPKQFQDQPAYAGSAVSDAGWVSQVRVFSIFNGIQGALEIPVGLIFAGMGVLFPVLTRLDEFQKGQNGQEPPPTEFFWLVGGFYFVIGVPVLLCGILRIVAAFRNYRFKSRTLGMVSIIAGLCSMLSCYCAPTGVGLLVYGLILFLNPAVKAAFEMVEKGQTVAQVLAAFSPYPQQSYYQPPSPPT